MTTNKNSINTIIATAIITTYHYHVITIIATAITTTTIAVAVAVAMEATVNQIELAKYFNLNKSTIGRYLKSGKLLLNKYSIRKN